MPNTMTLIASSTVGSGGTSSINFSSIPQTFTDLCLKLSGRLTTGSYGNMNVTFNGTSSGYTNRLIDSDGANVTSATANTTSLYFVISNSSGGTSVFSSGEIYIPNYTSTNNKSTSNDQVSEDNLSTAFQRLIAGLFTTSSPITSISITPEPGFGNIVQYSTAYLYGIKKD
jgi:hypothetical protein